MWKQPDAKSLTIPILSFEERALKEILVPGKYKAELQNQRDPGTSPDLLFDVTLDESCDLQQPKYKTLDDLECLHSN